MRLLVVLISLNAISDGAQARQTSEDSAASPIVRDFAAFWEDAGYAFSAPARFGTEEWIAAGAVAGGTALLFTADDPMRDLVRRNQSTGADRLSSFGNACGNGLNVIVVCAATYGFGLAIQDEGVRTTGRLMFEAAAFAGLTTTVIKSLAGRSRPYTGDGPYKFHFVEFDNDYLSLPSGHATLAFAISSVLSQRIGNVFAGIALYSAAAVTAWSRMYEDEHWLSDTFLGATIGTAFGYAVAGERDDAGREKSSLRIFPGPGGVAIVYNF